MSQETRFWLSSLSQNFIRWAALPIAALSVTTGFANWHLALTVAAACVLGLIFVIPRRAIILAAVLGCPFAPLAVIVSTTTWHSPLFRVFGALLGDAALSLPIGLVLGGSAICSLIPFAAARWSRSSLLVALVAWGAGLVVTAYAASLAVSFLTKPTRQLDSDRASMLRAMNYSWWLSYNGLTQRALYFHYEGRVNLEECLGSPAHMYKFSIPIQERDAIEQYTNGPLVDDIRKWFLSEKDYDLNSSCSTTVTENSDRTIDVSSACEPTSFIRRLTGRDPRYNRSFSVPLPSVHLQAPLLVPGRDSQFTITAPRGCIAHTFPAADSINFDKGTETFRLPVGFPRNSFSLMDASHILEEPWLVHVELVKPAFQGVFIGWLLRALNSWTGMTIFFLVTALAFRTLVLNLYRILLGPLITKIDPHANAAWRVVRQWYLRRSRALRWSLIFAVLFVGALATFPDLIEFVILLPLMISQLPELIWALAKLVFALPTLIAFEPPLAIAAILFVIAVCFIEIVAFILRRSLRSR